MGALNSPSFQFFVLDAELPIFCPSDLTCMRASVRASSRYGLEYNVPIPRVVVSSFSAMVMVSGSVRRPILPRCHRYRNSRHSTGKRSRIPMPRVLLPCKSEKIVGCLIGPERNILVRYCCTVHCFRSRDDYGMYLACNNQFE